MILYVLGVSILRVTLNEYKSLIGKALRVLTVVGRRETLTRKNQSVITTPTRKSVGVVICKTNKNIRFIKNFDYSTKSL